MSVAEPGLLNKETVDEEDKLIKVAEDLKLTNQTKDTYVYYNLSNISNIPPDEKEKYKELLKNVDPEGKYIANLKERGIIKDTPSTEKENTSSTEKKNKFEDWFSENWINLLSVLLLLTGIGFFITWYVMDGSNFHVYETDKTIEKSDKIWIFLYVAISCFVLGSLLLIYRIITDEDNSIKFISNS